MRLLLLIAALFATPAASCELGLILAMDRSSSIKGPDKMRASEAVREALLHPALAPRLTTGRVYLTAFDWSDQQQVVVPWVSPSHVDELATAVRSISGFGSSVGNGTLVTGAYRFAAALSEAQPCERYVVDIVTDGDPSEPEGRLRPSQWLLEGVHQVNVLYVGDDPGRAEEIRFGEFSFVMHVPTWQEFAAAFLRKLSLELAQDEIRRSG